LSSSSSDDDVKEEELTKSQRSLWDMLGELPTTPKDRADAIGFRRRFKVRLQPPTYHIVRYKSKRRVQTASAEVGEVRKNREIVCSVKQR